MSFNLQKCELIKITNKKHPCNISSIHFAKPYRLQTHAKYLGVSIDKNLSWSEHIKQITKKANNVKYFLLRNINKCPTHTKSNCHKALVKPILEYASTVWLPPPPHTHTHTDIDAIENVQRRATRFVTTNYSQYARNIIQPELAHVNQM